MTRYAKRKTGDMLHCTFSAIIDIFEMEKSREPTSREVNNIISAIGCRGARVK
ncbi:MAG: hypothetical protein OIN89_00545 [Candidatus Methanoperedens sp.]|nr:hypothetical protein [Candidatus Methanoperedens sp.]